MDLKCKTVSVSKISSVLLLNVVPLFSSVPKLHFQQVQRIDTDYENKHYNINQKINKHYNINQKINKLYNINQKMKEHRTTKAEMEGPTSS